MESKGTSQTDRKNVLSANSETKLVPLLLSPEGMRVLVIGGGQVALRKCLHFEGAEITVIAEITVPGIENVAVKVIKRRTTASEISEMMGKFDIIVAATNDAAMNSEIRDTALKLGLRVNSAHGGGNIVIPSVLRRKEYTVCVSTEGRLPAFPPYVINELETMLDERFDIMFEVLAESRRMCSGKGTQAERAEFLKRVAYDSEVNRLVRKGDAASALERAKKLGVPT
jgi:siroheme synthase-like protein